MNLHSILAVWSPFSIPSCLSLVQEVVERLEAVSKEKKRAENRLVHHEFMPAAMHRLFLFGLMRAGVIYRNSGIVLRQFKAPNEHKFDCLFALLMQFLTRTRYISTNLSAIFLLGVTFRQVFSKINYAKGCASKLQQKN